jgi:hypothetical protein
MTPKQFYLETNSIRRLGGRLKNYSQFSFTSSLSILELIAGVSANDEKQFKVRKAAVKNTLGSGIYIDWRAPIDIIISAFPVLGGEDRIISSLKNIANVFIEVENYVDFYEECHRKKLPLDHFVKLDEDFGKEYKLATTDKLKELKKIKDNSKLPVKFIVKMNKAIEAVVDSLLNSMPVVPPQEAKTKIITSYNGRIDVFLKFWVWYSNLKLEQWGDGGRNDWIDLHHAVYLTNEVEVAIVTEDKLILEGVNTVSPGQALGTQEFLNLLH